MSKIARPGSEGNTRLLKQYGGGSSPPRQSYPKGYATGGAVKNPALAEGVEAAGGPAKVNLSRPGRKMGGKAPAGKSGKGKGTNVNVIVMPHGGDKGAPPAGGPPPDMPMAGPGPGPMPPMPPPGAGPGGPPMPMRAKGGRVNEDAKADKKMIADAVHKHEKHDHKGQKLTKLSVGGPAKPARGFDAGAGGGKGRLEKLKKYGV